MRALLFSFLLIGVFALLGKVNGDELPAKAGSAAGKTGSYGTSVDFVGTPKEAARLAAERKRLVFVLHVSGHFEDPDIT